MPLRDPQTVSRLAYIFSVRGAAALDTPGVRAHTPIADDDFGRQHPWADVGVAHLGHSRMPPQRRLADPRSIVFAQRGELFTAPWTSIVARR